MRKGDLELVEMHLEPLRSAKDRHDVEINSLERFCKELADRVKDLERDKEAHATSIAQGLASVRSMLQRSNRAARALEEEEEEGEELPVDPAPQPMNIRTARDDVIRRARAKMHGGNLL